MRSNRWRLCIALVAVGTLAACGGSQRTYSASATATCLRGVGADVSASDADYIVQSASGGGYLVRLNEFILNMAFGSDESEGKKLYDQYTSVGGNGLVGRSSNVVMSWDENPPSNVEKLIRGCLR